MVKFRRFDQIEHQYHFTPAVSDADVLNGAFGNVTDGKFVASESGDSVVMQLEDGDDIGLDEYKIVAGTPLRILKLDEMVGQELEVYGYPLPTDFKVDTVVGKFKVIGIIGNSLGAVVVVQ